MVQTLTKKQEDILVEAVNNKINIYQLSRNLGKTISETSLILGDFSRNNSKFQDIFESLNWPVSITQGHIYIGGDKTSTAGENKEKLQIGDHVIVENSIRGKAFCELFESIPIHQDYYYFGISKDKGKTWEYIGYDEWFSQQDFLDGKVHDYAKEKQCNYTVLYDKDYKTKTGQKISLPRKSRVIYKKGEWLGTPSTRAVVSVNSNFK